MTKDAKSRHGGLGLTGGALLKSDFLLAQVFQDFYIVPINQIPDIHKTRRCSTIYIPENGYSGYKNIKLKFDLEPFKNAWYLLQPSSKSEKPNIGNPVFAPASPA